MTSLNEAGPWRFTQQSKTRRKRLRRQGIRRLRLETLEPRQLLDGSWQNPFNPRDVNRDGVVVPQDVLVGINELNARQYIDQEGQLPDRSLHPNAPFYDFNDDGKFVPLDVLPIINRYNSDVVPPTFVVALTNDTAPGGTNTDLLTKDDRVSGTLTDDTGVSSLIATVDNGPANTVTVSFDGTFQFDPDFSTDGSSDGEHEVRFIATDGRGNQSDAFEFTFQLDTVGLPPPTSLAIDAASDTGSSNSDGVTNDNTPTIHGDATAGSVVQVYSNSQLIGQTTANSPWSLTTAPIEDGIQELSIIAFDAAGNPSDEAHVTLTVDTIVPDAPASLGLTAATDTGLSQTDGITNNSTPTIVGTSEAGTTVIITLDEELAGEVSGVNWQFIPGELLEGETVVGVAAKDLAGNISPASDLIVTLDTQSPAPPSDLRLTSASDTGQSATDGITRVTTPTYTTDAETGTLVRLFIDGDMVASATANGPVMLPVTSLLAEGQYAVLASVEDVAGNVGASMAEATLLIDSTAPSAATMDLSATSDTATPGDQITSVGVVTMVGTAESNSQVVLTANGISALASHAGSFQLTGVPLALGDNVFQFETLDAAGNTANSQITITRTAGVAGVDPVLRWNQAILNAIKRDASSPPNASRFLAMLHIAVFDAVSNIDGTPSYMVRLTPPSGASAEAAVSTAAHSVLSYAFPGQTTWFDDELDAALAAIPDGSARSNGEAFGRDIAEAVIEIRSQDGWLDFVDYIPTTTPGAWQPTAPFFDVALLPQWAQLDPFAMTDPAQFRPAGPPELSSEEYAIAVNEVKLLGRNLGSTRTDDQTAIARFWADGTGTVTPPGHWNDIAQDVVAGRENSMVENARLFAMLNVAMADAAISSWNTKFHYNFWRPITAIQLADDDGNDQTVADETWEPLLITPPFPDYTSGHSTFSGAAAEILTNMFGENVSFTSDSPGFVQADGVTPVQRSFTSFVQAAEEAGRSRVYGGIHFEFASQDGLASGQSLGDYVWQSFTSAVDQQPPRILILNPEEGHFASGNITVTGSVFDNVSGVESLEVSADGGAFVAVPVNSDGSFTLTTTLATNGSADGLHRLQFRATDFRGNTVTNPEFVWTLDTILPTISITETPETGILAGTASGTGSPITKFAYRVGSGETISMTLPSANDSFTAIPDISRVAPGTHTITVIATDSAGLTREVSAEFELISRIAFRVIDHSPDSGTIDIGSTYRPQVFFSRPVDTDTLSNDNFYATDSTGSKVPATIVPAQDGTFAWLFFTNPLPGSSTITIHVDGNTIAAEDDGVGLDADGDGQPGGELTYSFSTVGLTPLPGTSLSGKVVDPGIDLKPMTFDDFRPGPDGVPHTPDDKFLLPIAGVKVFILGLEDDFVVTDAGGNFHFDSVPGGNIKLAVDGRTATTPPQGIYFPEMVMDMFIHVGVANTVMGTMGTLEEMKANSDRQEVYLPRLQLDILQDVSNTQDTLITVDGTAAPNLTDEQRQFMTLEVQPQSLIGPDGQPLMSGQVGLSTVPPELVREMLPPGLLQHTFDITIQAPEAATFSVPLTLTLPNVFNSPPGTKLNFLSFDHTTGRLVIEGTGTVSADGLSVVTDPGTGITKPGWHGFTPPDTCATSGGIRQRKTLPESLDEKVPQAIFLHDDLEHLNVINKTIPAPKKKDPPTNQPNGCPAPQEDPKDDPPTELTIEVQGPLGAFMHQRGDLPFASNTYLLARGSKDRTFKMDAKSLADMFGEEGFLGLQQDMMYGSTVRITVVSGPATARKRTIESFVIYKWIDVVDATMAKDKHGTTAAFMRTFANGEFTRSKNIATSLPTKYETRFEGTGTKPFEYGQPPRGSGMTRWFFKPAASDAGEAQVADDVQIIVTVPFGGGVIEVPVGTLHATGKATKESKISVDQSGYKAELKRVILGLKEDRAGVYHTHRDGRKAYASDRFTSDEEFGKFLPNKRQPGPDGVLGNENDTFQDADLEAKLNDAAEKMLKAVEADYKDIQGYVVQAENAGADVQMNWMDLGSNDYGAAGGDPASFTRGQNLVLQAMLSPSGKKISAAAQQWYLAQEINTHVESLPNLADEINVFAVGINIKWTSSATFAQFVANTVSHELGHTFGLIDSYDIRTGLRYQPLDIMMNGRDSDPNLEFAAENKLLLKAAIGSQPNGDLALADALKLYQEIFFAARRRPPELHRDEVPDSALFPYIRLVRDELSFTGGDIDEAGTVAADGAGGQFVTLTYLIENPGLAPLELDQLHLSRGNVGFSLVNPPAAGTTLEPYESIELQVKFDPIAVGTFSDELVIESNAEVDPEFHLTLAGTAISSAARMKVTTTNNNLGGSLPGNTVSMAEFATIENLGNDPLLVSAITLDAGSAFTITGLPADIATTPITLDLGETFTFGIQFNADRVGLLRGDIRIATNDPLAPVERITAIGTGLPDVVFPQWGDDFVAMETSPGTNTLPLRVKSDPAGNFQLIIQPDQLYHIAIFDPITGLITHGYGTTPEAGGNLDVTADLVFLASDAPDTDYDGLPDDVEFAIGTSLNKSDSDGDLLSDGVEIQQGWNPLDDSPLPLGVIASQALSGEAKEIVLEGSFTDGDGQLAFVATGTYGLGIVDTSKFFGPVVLGQIDLLGDATDVATDASSQLAVVATNAGGIQIIDVSDPKNPEFVMSRVVPASQVEVLDGVAYVNHGTKLRSIDLVTGTTIHELDLGGGNIKSIARERSTLYTLDAGNVLRAVDISGPTMALRDSIPLPVAASKLFVASGVAYVGDSVAGGFATVDVSNANDLILIAGPSDQTLAVADMIATGSGQALSIGTAAGVTKLQLLDVSVLSETGNITDTFDDLPGELHDIAAGGGFGYIAAGAAGLLTFNYLGLDRSGVAPIVDVGTNLIDLDLGQPGVQVLEGTTVPLVVAVTDDKQVRNVELLIDGRVVRNDVSFPFDFSAIALTDAVHGQVRVRVRATDTGGNVGLSQELLIEAVPDTTAPTILDTSPNDGATRGQLFRTVQIEFSEPMDASSLIAANIELRGPGDVVIHPIDIQIRHDDKFIQLTYPTLDAGDYEIVVHGSNMRDRAGNVLSAADVTTTFTVSEQAISWINVLGGEWNDPQNWDQGYVPGPFDHVVIDVPENVTIFYRSGDSEIASLYSSNRFTLSGGRLLVHETVKVDNAFLIDGGTLAGATVLAGVDGQGIMFSDNDGNRLDGVTVNANLDLTRDEAVVRVANGLTLNGTANIWGSLARIAVEGTQTISSGRFVMNTDETFGLDGGIAAATTGTSLTLGENVTVEGHGNLGVNQFFSVFVEGTFFPFVSLTNNGTIEATHQDRQLSVFADEFSNEGLLKVRHGGQLLIQGLTGNANDIEVLHPDSRLSLHGHGYVINDGATVNHGSSLVLGGEWTNAPNSTISVTNAKVTLGAGDHPWSNEGTINITDSQVIIGGSTDAQSLADIQLQEGSLLFFGSVDNTGQDLDLDTFSSKWTSGQIRGGTINTSNSLPVELPAGMFGSDWTLVDTVIQEDIIVPKDVALQLFGDWKNEAKITVDGGRLFLGSQFTAADLGHIETINGGEVLLVGTFENTGSNFEFGDEFAVWSMAGGTIHGGTISFVDPDTQNLVGTSLGGTLDGVTVEGDLVLKESFSKLTIAGGTTFRTAYLASEKADLEFAPQQVLTGTVVFDPGDCQAFFCSQQQSISLLGPNASLTIGPTGEIRTAEGYVGTANVSELGTLSGGSITNQGIIILEDDSNLDLNLAEMRNEGSIRLGQEARLLIQGMTGNVNDLEVEDGMGSVRLIGHDFIVNEDLQVNDLSLDGTWTNTATITVTNGLGLSLNDDNPADRWHNLGSINVSNTDISIGGTYSVADLDNIHRTGFFTPSLGGTLDNSNATLEIDELLADWRPQFSFFLEAVKVHGGTITAANEPWVMNSADRVEIDGATLQVDVTVTQGAALQMSGEWTNTGTMDVKGILSLLGKTTTAGLGTIKNTSGTVVLHALIDNVGANLTLDNNTGVWVFGNGAIVGGTLTVGDGSKFPIMGSAQLEGVDVDGELRIIDPQNVICCGTPSLTLFNNTTIDTIHLDAFFGELRISANQSITGEVLLLGAGGQVVRSIHPATTLTVASTGAIRTADGYAGFAQIGAGTETPKIINEGTIESRHLGNALLVNPVSMMNTGTLRASNGGSLTVTGLSGNINTVDFGVDGGTIQLFGNEFIVNTPIDVPENSVLNLQGHWTNVAGITSQDATLVLGDNGDFGPIDATDSIIRFTGTFTLADLDTIQRSGGSLELVGTLDNTGQSIGLDTLATDWKFAGGEIVDGTVTTAGEFVLPNDSDLTLVDVEFNGTVRIPTGTKLTLLGEWKNAGSIIVDGGDLILGGMFDHSAIGDIQRDDGRTILQGSLDNRGETLELDNSTGSWRIAGGEILGGTVVLNDSQTLIATSVGGTLRGVDIQGDLTLAEDLSRLFLVDGTTFENAHMSGFSTELIFGPNEVITGNVVFEGNAGGDRAIRGEGFLTIDTAAVIRTAVGFFGNAAIGDEQTWVVNNGTILADANGSSLSVRSRTLDNSGRIETSNGSVLSIESGDWRNTGLLKVDSGTLELSGDYATASITPPRLERTGGTVQLDGWLNNIESTLALNSSTGSWIVAGAEIYGGTYTSAGGNQLVVENSAVLNALTANGPLEILNATVGVRNGLVLNDVLQLGGNNFFDSGSLLFAGSQTLSGTGEVVFGASQGNGLFLSDSNSVLTIGDGITVHGDSGQIGDDQFQFSPVTNLFVINRGTIISDSNIITIGNPNAPIPIGGQAAPVVAAGAKLLNLGTLRVLNGATLQVTNIVGSVGVIELPASTPDGGNLSLNGTDYVIDHPLVMRPGSNLELLGSWTNTAGNEISVEDGELTLGSGDESWKNLGTISVDDSTVNLDGVFRSADLGTYERTGAVVTNLRGTLDNTGATFALNASTGSWNLDEGTIRGGTITQSGGAALVLPFRSFGALDGVTLADDLLVGQEYELTIRNGLTLDTSTVTLVAVDNVCCEAVIRFDGTQSVMGQGEIVLETNNFGNAGLLDVIEDDASLTFGPQVTIRGAGDIASSGPITVLGTILANIPGETLTIEADPLTNMGIIRAENAANLEIIGLINKATVEANSNATLSLDEQWSNTLGTLKITNAFVNLGGEFKTSDLGSFDRTGGNVNLTGTLDNVGSTLTLDSSTGSWRLEDGTILGGDYTAANGAKLIFSDAGGTLDSFTASGDLDLTETAGAIARILNGLTLDNSTIHLGNAIGTTDGGLSFEGTSTLDGTGTVIFGKNSSNFLNTFNTEFNNPAAGTVTIGENITIRGSTGIFSDSIFPGRIVNLGSILLDESGGGTLTIHSEFVNSGSIAVHDEETLEIFNLSSPNAGSIHVQAGGVVDFSADFAQASSGLLAVDLAGTTADLIGRVAITGAATLDGDLHVAIVDGFIPVIGDIFVPFTFGTLTGQFDNIVTTGLPAGTAIQATYNANDLTLTVVAALRGQSGLADRSSDRGKMLSNNDVRPLFAAAIDQWCSWEAASEACDSLGNVAIIIADLGSDYLGFAAGNRIWIDDDAAGLGWFVDETADDDEEFGDDGSPVGYDLLTVLSHELGHLLGAGHSHSEDSHHDSDAHDGVMAESLAAGIRHRVSTHDIDTVFGEDADWF